MTQGLAGHAWWLASRASGLVALALVTVSVVLGLTMAGKLSKKPGAGRVLSAIHEQTAVTGLVAIAVHGLTLLGDAWLNPGPAGIMVPFLMAYRPLWTGFGIIAGWLAALLGLSFYMRRRIGPRLWRQAHKATIVVYILGVAHTLGAGTDASSPWLYWPIAFSSAVIGVLFVARVVQGIRKGRARAKRARPARPVASGRPALAAIGEES
jgi:methionine sulfoxide reductase heme-binding subunit